MLRGYYTAASGMVTQEKKLNTYANNITNASTVGYKKDNMVSGVFGEHLAVRMNAYQNVPHNSIGPGVYMQVIDEKYTDDTQGAFEYTQRPMDVAIAGNGYFVIQKEDGEYLARDGQFSIDDEGYLVLPGFGRVLGENGELQVGTSSVAIDRQGYISVLPVDAEEDEEPELLDRLLIVVPENLDDIDKANDSLYTTGAYNTVDGSNTAILQGTLEKSNVNMAEEMTRVIASQRALQSCSQILKMYDELAEKINTQISRIQTCLRHREELAMIRGFYTARSGLMAHQEHMSVMANNLANTNTVGFKPMRTAFTDLMYQNLNRVKNENAAETGHGVKINKNDIMMHQGALEPTNRELDFAILDEGGFFAVETRSGDVHYSRAGDFSLSDLDDTFSLVNGNGDYVLDADGQHIEVEFDEENKMIFDQSDIGVLRFPNHWGLEAINGNSFLQTDVSGEPESIELPSLKVGYIEGSAVEISTEMANVIESTKAFSFSSKMIQVADEIEQTVNQLR